MKHSGVLGRLHGYAWLLTGALGCAGARPAAKPPSVVVATPTKLEPAPEQPLPTLTAPPPTTPALIYRVDLQRLVSGMTRGATVSFDPNKLMGVGSFPGVSLTRPILLAGTLDLRRALIAWPASGALTRGSEPLEPALRDRGWAPLAGGRCATRDSPKFGPTVACGSGEALLALGDSLDVSAAGLGADHAIELSMSTHDYWERLGVHELRDAVPRQVDEILAPAELGKSMPLRLALSDLGFDLSGRLLAASEELSRVAMSISFDGEGAAQYDVRLAASSSSPIGQVIAQAQSVTPSKSLWQLPYEVKTAMYADSSLLAALLTPGRRASALLAAAQGGAGGVASALSAAFSACVPPNRMVALVGGELPAAKKPLAHEPVPPAVTHRNASENKASPAKTTSDSSAYSLALIDDPAGACAVALGGLVQAIAAVEDQTKKPSERPLEVLKPLAQLPKGATVARFGSGQSAFYAAISASGGSTQIVGASSLANLSAVIAAERAAQALRRTLAQRSELAVLATQPALFGGFSDEDQLLNGVSSALSVAPRAKTDARVPFSVSHDGATPIMSGRFKPETIRALGADLIEGLADQREWSTLKAEQKSALVDVLEKSCRLGSNGACNTLGVRYGDGNELGKDIDRAHELLSLSCSRGHGMSCVNLGFYGSSPSEQLTTFEKACALESPFGCAWYGARLLQSKKTEERGEAIPKLEFACDHGNGFGCAELGSAFLQGTGVTRDEEKGADYEQRACQLHFGSGCVSLGNAYVNGVGRKKNPAYALEAYKVGCKLDKENGCYALGIAYAQGIGGPKDLSAAKVQLTVACDAGQADACRLAAELPEAP